MFALVGYTSAWASMGTARENPIRRVLLIGAVCGLGCDSTRLDAIVATGGETPIPQECVPLDGAVLAGTYRVRAVGARVCWQIGSETSIFGMRGYLIAMTGACTLQGEWWRFENSASVPGAFEIHSTSKPGFSLDVQESAREDGTNVITYGSHSLPNQRFFVRERSAGVYEFSPAHVPQSCIATNDSTALDASGIRIEACQSSAPVQQWELLAEGCGGASGS